MGNNELESLLTSDTILPEGNKITKNAIKIIDEIICKNSSKISPEVIGVYKKFMPMKQQAPDSMKTVLFDTIRNFASEEGSKGHYASELLLYRFLIIKSDLIPKDYLNIAKCINNIDSQNDIIAQFTDLFERTEDNKLLVYIELADFYKSTGELKKTIEYYEKFLTIDKTKAVIYNITADLYSKTEPYTSIQRQIELYEASYKLQPESRLALHGLAFCYEKINNNEKADYYYKKLLGNNPTENDFYNYGAFLIHCGDFINGHKYFTHRFNIDDINLKYPIEEPFQRRWDFKEDIKGKTLVIHYEQGFGDTIMYSRFVPEMKKFTKKIIFVVQDELFDLINNSKLFDDTKVVTKSEFKGIEYDYSMALLDCPFALGTTADNMPCTNRYLSVNNSLIKKYAQENINKNNKIKIGISTSGAVDSNYNNRNLDITKLKFLADKKNVEIYFLQKDVKNIPEEFINLGKTFNDFTDSACAIENMDLIISTDNVILNLAGALGKKTIALFNNQTNYRWYKTSGDDTGWYKSVKPFQNKIQNDWTELLINLNNIVSKL